MTNKEAIEIFSKVKELPCGWCYEGGDEFKKALDLAIKALEERPQGDLISREALLKAMEEERQYLLARGQTGAEHIIVHHCLPIIDNAPTVFDEKAYSDGYTQGTCDCEHAHERQKGEWKINLTTGDIFCSCCKEVRRDTRIKHINFCNSCGADMRGGAE